MNKLEAIEIIEQNKIQVSLIVERNSEEEVIQNKIKLVDYVPLDIVVNTMLDGYEVEKEKRYRVLIKDGLVLNRRLVKSPIANTFEFVIGSNLGILGIESFTKQELIEAGFGGVFDNEMFEVVEAEDD